MEIQLNEAQQRAVRVLGGPLLVLAGAGTGKTRVVTCRVAELIRRGIEPARILAVTFTNKAADEMHQRIRSILDSPRGGTPRICTFHAHAVDVLRRHITRLGYPSRFAIYDTSDQEAVARKVLRELRLDTATMRPMDLVAQISRWKSAGVRPAQAAELADTDRLHLAAAAYRRYQQALQALGAVDFDDLLLLTLDLFDKYPEVEQLEASRFDHLLIDEYQDTNQAQYQIVKRLAAPHRNLCVVGDDDQAIYGFRGADVSHILRFQRDWPDAVVIRLEENYRSCQAILQAANRLIAHNRQRHAKILRAARPGGEKPRIEQFPDEEAEAAGVVAEIRRRLNLPGRQYRDFAILFRMNEQTRPFETELRRAGLPYVLIGSTSFFDRTEVRDVLAFLRTIEQPSDEVSLLRTLQTPPRGIGRSTIQQLLAEATSRGVTLWDHLLHVVNESSSEESAAALHRFVRQWESFHTRRSRGAFRTLHEMVMTWLEECQYRSYLEQRYTDSGEAATRWSNVEQIVNALAAFEQTEPNGTLHDFLTQIAVTTREFEDPKERRLQRNAVVLMTLHSAKGLEFPEVYLVGMEEGILPHHKALAENEQNVDEERRLCYVGMTRAQDRLTLTLALTRRKWGKPRETQPSRFLFELTGLAERPSPKNAPQSPSPPQRPTSRRARKR